MAKCEDVQLELSTYLDGELSVQEKLALDAHLVVCETCNAVLSELEATKAAVGGLTRLKAPAGLRQKISQKISLESQQKPQPAAPVAVSGAGGAFWRRAALAVAALIVIGLLINLASPVSKQTPASGSAAATQVAFLQKDKGGDKSAASPPAQQKLETADMKAPARERMHNKEPAPDIAYKKGPEPEVAPKDAVKSMPAKADEFSASGQLSEAKLKELKPEEKFAAAPLLKPAAAAPALPPSSLEAKKGIAPEAPAISKSEGEKVPARNRKAADEAPKADAPLADTVESIPEAYVDRKASKDAPANLEAAANAHAPVAAPAPISKALAEPGARVTEAESTGAKRRQGPVGGAEKGNIPQRGSPDEAKPPVVVFRSHDPENLIPQIQACAAANGALWRASTETLDRDEVAAAKGAKKSLPTEPEQLDNVNLGRIAGKPPEPKPQRFIVETSPQQRREVLTALYALQSILRAQTQKAVEEKKESPPAASKPTAATATKTAPVPSDGDGRPAKSQPLASRAPAKSAEKQVPDAAQEETQAQQAQPKALIQIEVFGE